MGARDLGYNVIYARVGVRRLRPTERPSKGMIAHSWSNQRTNLIFPTGTFAEVLFFTCLWLQGLCQPNMIMFLKVETVGAARRTPAFNRPRAVHARTVSKVFGHSLENGANAQIGKTSARLSAITARHASAG